MKHRLDKKLEICNRCAEERVKKLDDAQASCQHADRVKQGARNRGHPSLQAAWPNRLETNPCILIPSTFSVSCLYVMVWLASMPWSAIPIGFYGITSRRFQPGRSQGQSSHFPSESSLPCRNLSPLDTYPVKRVKAGQAISGAKLLFPFLGLNAQA